MTGKGRGVDGGLLFSGEENKPIELFCQDELEDFILSQI